MSVSGTLTNGSGALINLTDDAATLFAGNVSNSGTISLGCCAETFQVSGALQNSGTISTLVQATIQAGSLTNSGSIQLDFLSSLRVNGDVNNSGTIYTMGTGSLSADSLPSLFE